MPESIPESGDIEQQREATPEERQELLEHIMNAARLQGVPLDDKYWANIINVMSSDDVRSWTRALYAEPVKTIRGMEQGEGLFNEKEGLTMTVEIPPELEEAVRKMQTCLRAMETTTDGEG